MNTSPFRANYEIKDPQLLFGRKEELKNLCAYAEGLLQVEIIGARRFGKTCLLKSFITLQKENVNRKTYPVYIDAYSDSIKGTTNVYRYLTSQLITNLLTDGYINERVIIIDNFNITNLEFSEEYSKAIEEKQVAEQKLEKARLEAEAKLVEAKATKEANDLMKKTLTKEIITKEFIEKWDGKLPSTYAGEDIMGIFNLK